MRVRWHLDGGEALAGRVCGGHDGAQEDVPVAVAGLLGGVVVGAGDHAAVLLAPAGGTAVAVILRRVVQYGADAVLVQLVQGGADGSLVLA